MPSGYHTMFVIFVGFLALAIQAEPQHTAQQQQQYAEQLRAHQAAQQAHRQAELDARARAYSAPTTEYRPSPSSYPVTAYTTQQVANRSPYPTTQPHQQHHHHHHHRTHSATPSTPHTNYVPTSPPRNDYRTRHHTRAPPRSHHDRKLAAELEQQRKTQRELEAQRKKHAEQEQRRKHHEAEQRKKHHEEQRKKHDQEAQRKRQQEYELQQRKKQHEQEMHRKKQMELEARKRHEEKLRLKQIEQEALRHYDPRNHYTTSHISSPAVACDIPPDLWCDSMEIARACGVETKCAELRRRPIKITLIYEALCPFCQRFIANQLGTVFNSHRGAFELEMIPWGNSRLNADGSFSCNHGQKECDANRLQSCVLDVLQVKGALPFIVCFEKAIFQGSVDHAMQSCSVFIRSHEREIRQCYTSERGVQLQRIAAQKTFAARPQPIVEVPYLLINDYSPNTENNDLNVVMFPQLLGKWTKMFSRRK